jgi:transposase
MFRVRELVVRQRMVVPQGATNAAPLIALVVDPNSGFPAEGLARHKVVVTALAHLKAEIGKLDAEMT